jgi:hypothetical protein
MNYKVASFIVVIFLGLSGAAAQVQVSKEPHHKKVLENKYLRVLDVRIKPGDTTLFHIHSTPSLFVYFTTQDVCIQLKDKEWEKSKNTGGEASYRSFVNDTLIHRVSNCDTIPFHVMDIELVSPYKPETPKVTLPFTVLFNNDKAIAYRLTGKSFNNKIISNHGPMIAAVMAGDEIIYNDVNKRSSANIKTGNYFYIEPGNTFYLLANENANVLLFEIK